MPPAAVLQAARESQGTGDMGHGRTVEKVGDRMVVSFGNGTHLALQYISRMIALKEDEDRLSA